MSISLIKLLFNVVRKVLYFKKRIEKNLSRYYCSNDLRTPELDLYKKIEPKLTSGYIYSSKHFYFRSF